MPFLQTGSGTFDLDIKDLSVSYPTRKGALVVVDRVSVTFTKGKIYALVGESGRSKTTFWLAIPRLFPENQARYADRIEHSGMNIPDLDEEELEGIRGSRFAPVFQESMTSLDPQMMVECSVVEALTSANEGTKRKKKEVVAEALRGGCRFYGRCPYAKDNCLAEEPAFRKVESSHSIRCHFAEKIFARRAN